MKQTKVLVGFLFLIVFSTYGQSLIDKPLFSIGFDSAAGPALLKQCSRATPKHISAYWTLTKNNIDELEKNFPKIDLLISKECCVIGVKIKDRKYCGFQYVGVVINKRKYIYINAFPAGEIETVKKYDPTFNPAKTPIIVCDGGESFWGALYDIETKTFSLLSFNGYV